MTKVTVAFRDSAKAPNNDAGDSKMVICGNAEKFGAISPRLNLLDCEGDHLSPCIAKVKKSGAITSHPSSPSCRIL
jgi:hypothetical protein